MPRFRKRRRRFRRRRPRRFTRVVRRIVRTTLEPKRLVISDATVNFSEADINGSILNIKNITSNVIQGTEDDQVAGNRYFVDSVSIRGQAENLSNYVRVYIRYTLVFSRTNAGAMTGNGATYSVNTTSTTNPTQTTPLLNPVLFRSASSGVAYPGIGFLYPFDTTNLKVLKSRTVKINPGGNISAIGHWALNFKIKRIFQMTDPTQTGLTSAPNHGKYGSYYLIRQTIQSGTGIVTDANPGLEQVILHFRDV